MAYIDQSIVKQFKKWFFEGCPKTLNLLITGKTGVGKSRLVNALVGQKVAPEGSTKEACTSEIKPYQTVIEGVRVTVWDSPGLQDGTSNEARYIQDMKRKVKDVALMIYCINMAETRFYDADKKAIRIMTEEFGKEVWENAVVALTFANKVDDPDGGDELQYFQYQHQEWKKDLTNYLAAVGLNPEACRSIPVIPVGNKRKSMRLPDRENWLSDLWIECYQVMKASARRGMYRINKDRLKFTSSLATPDRETASTTTSYATTKDEDDIPHEIPLNEQQEESFLKATWNAFVNGVRKFFSFGWKVLKTFFS